MTPPIQLTRTELLALSEPELRYHTANVVTRCIPEDKVPPGVVLVSGDGGHWVEDRVLGRRFIFVVEPSEVPPAPAEVRCLIRRKFATVFVGTEDECHSFIGFQSTYNPALSFQLHS